MTTPVSRETSQQPRSPQRATAGRGLSRTIWAIAAACWVVTVAATLLGGHGHGHHDAVLSGSAMPWHWRLGAFAAAWTVMVGAMMLPSAIPMLQVFWAASAGQQRPALARTAMVVPYVAVWLGFAGLALAADAMVHALVATWGWLAARPDLLLGGVLVLAGAFQFTELKKACLTGCRSPLGMMWEHYRHGIRAAWGLGVRHALLCLGCCWALMLVMFATGTGALAWMLLLTGVMVAEKTTSWGARLVTPTGVGFIASGLLVVVTSATTAPAAPVVSVGMHTGHQAGHGAGPDLSVVALLLVTLVVGVWAVFTCARVRDA
jgi:predicted metal-binding membrane protein